MKHAHSLSRGGKVALSMAALFLLVGSGIALAETQHIYTSSYEFQVVDPTEPNIVTWVNGSFTGQPIMVYVNISSQEGVTHLNGTYSVTVQVWNDTVGDFVDFQVLASNQTIDLTPTPVTLSYAFTTTDPGDYNIFVQFNAISATTG